MVSGRTESIQKAYGKMKHNRQLTGENQTIVSNPKKAIDSCQQF